MRKVVYTVYSVSITLLVTLLLSGCPDAAPGSGAATPEPGTLVNNGTDFIGYVVDGDSVVFTVEAVSDTTDDRIGTWPNVDIISMTVDTNRNSSIDPNVDTSYSAGGRSFTSLCTQYLLTSCSSSPCGGFVSSAALQSSFTTTSHSSSNHVVWTLTVPKAELSAGNEAEVVIKIAESGHYRTYPTDNSIGDSGCESFNSALKVSW